MFQLKHRVCTVHSECLHVSLLLFAGNVTVVYLSFVCQGLFRIAAGASKLKKLKAALDCSTSQLEEFYSDPHAVAGTSQRRAIYEFHCLFLSFLCLSILL